MIEEEIPYLLQKNYSSRHKLGKMKPVADFQKFSPTGRFCLKILRSDTPSDNNISW